MSQVNLNGASNVSGTLLSDVSRSPQMAFALLQMKLAEANKNEAMNGIHSIEATQAKKAEMAEMLNKARDMKQGHHYLNNWGDENNIPDDLEKWATENKINLPNQDDVGRPKKSGSCDNSKCDAAWDKVIAQIQTKMDTIGSDIQTKMVQLQDMMGQYNSYMQGANSAIATSNQTLSSLARGQ
ncbi:MAG: hypothetical protein IJT59_02810 [Desulfovibrionaceae bacterium]|nr:hypothetical protein [Desulfovibrionaceae bacterium]